MFDTVIKGGKIVLPNTVMTADLALQNGKIAALGSLGAICEAKVTVQAEGCYVFPGAIDPHVHVHWPFLAATTSDTYEIASKAAAIGGTTTFIDFAHPKMGPTPLERISSRKSEVGTDSVLDFSLHCVISDYTDDTLLQMEQLVKQGITSFKMYMTYSRRKIMADDAVLYFVMKKAAELGALVCVHAENGPLGDAMEAKFISAGRVKAVDFPQHKPNFIEAEATQRAVFWARETGVSLYFFHVTTAKGVELIRGAQKEGLPVYAETCPQYLLFDEKVFVDPDKGHRYICSPPIRSMADNEALWDGLADGTLSVMGTDHCAFTVDQKNRGIDNFIDVPNGLPGIETRLSLLWTEGVVGGRIDPVRFARILAQNPAKIFGLYPQKGVIEVGSDADLVIFDPNIPWTLKAEKTHMGVDWSPYEDWKMQGKVKGTIVHGEVVVRDGEFTGKNGGGKFLTREIPSSIYRQEIA